MVCCTLPERWWGGGGEALTSTWCTHIPIYPPLQYVSFGGISKNGYFDEKLLKKKDKNWGSFFEEKNHACCKWEVSVSQTICNFLVKRFLIALELLLVKEMGYDLLLCDVTRGCDTGKRKLKWCPLTQKEEGTKSKTWHFSSWVFCSNIKLSHSLSETTIFTCA